MHIVKSRRRSVLIADGDRAIARLIQMHLERAGFSVFVACDGEQAAILAARQRYELIITNLDLPVMGGEEFCHHVREDLGLTEVPIAVCSGSGTEDELNELVFKYGISRIFCKPIDAESVVEFARETVEYLVTGKY